MRMAVFGATGRTGREVVRQALERGHEVTAFVRAPGRLGVEHERLHEVVGSVEDAEAVAGVVGGRDAVLSALGAGNGTLAAFARSVLPALEAEGSGGGRLISLVGAGVRDPADTRSAGRAFMLALMRLAARDVLADAQRHAGLLRASGAAWTLVRPPRLRDGAARGRYRHAPSLPLGPTSTIARADVAEMMIEIAESGSYLREAPMVSD
jgi:putative NADH-flavin reductase